MLVIYLYVVTLIRRSVWILPDIKPFRDKKRLGTTGLEGSVVRQEKVWCDVVFPLKGTWGGV